MYVPIGNAVLEATTKNLRKLRQAELNSRVNPSTVKGTLGSDDVLRALLLNIVWKPLEDLRERLDVPEYHHVRTFKVCVVEDDRKTNIDDFRVENVKTMPCFRGINSDDGYGRPLVKITLTAQDYAGLVPLVEAKKAYDEANARWTQVETEIIGFLKKCKSANEAVKLYPQIVRYMPPDTMERINKKANRAERSDAEKAKLVSALNVEVIDQSTVIARLATAKG